MSLPNKDNLLHLGLPAALVNELETQVAPVVNRANGPLNTAITTVGAGTLTAAGIVGGVITRSGPTAAYTDTTDTAANIVAALPQAATGQSWAISIKNTVAFVQTVSGGTGVTVSGITVIPANSTARYLITYSAASTVTMVGVAVEPLTLQPLTVSTALTTVGAGTITAAGIVGGITARGGGQSAAAFTDTSDTAANIIAALPNAQIGQSWYWTYQNNTNGPATMAGGTGVTFSGVTLVPANMYAEFLVTYTAAATVTMAGVAMGQNVALPKTKFTSISSGNGTATAAQLAGGQTTVLATSGATALTTDTAANIIAAVPNWQIGDSYTLRVYNTNGATLTLTAGSSVTITGTATMLTAVWRDYLVTMTAATTVTMQNIGSGTAS